MAAVQARGRRFSRAASSPWDYNFGTPHTRGNVNGHVKLNYYSKLNRSPFDPDIAVNLSLRLAVSERLILSATADIRYRVEPDFEIEGSSNRKRGNYFFNRDELSASYRWLPSCCQGCRLPTPIRFLLLTMNLKVATRFIQIDSGRCDIQHHLEAAAGGGIQFRSSDQPDCGSTFDVSPSFTARLT